MVSDSIVNGSAPATLKDSGKKKRTNRTAKLKQCKLDARREQWLSRVKNKACKEESTDGGLSPPSCLQRDGEKQSLDKLETRTRGEGSEKSGLNDSDLDFESMANSPTSSVSGANDSRKNRPGSSSGSCRSSSSGGCYSGSEEEEEDECLDDWEAVADALTTHDNRHQPNSESPADFEAPVGSSAKLPSEENLKLESEETVSRVAENSRAWRPDDAFRPQSLPNLSKQHSFTMTAERHCGRGAVTWACRSVNSPPSSCPICCEDLDITDSNFLPCLCGFRLCLFCHKRILEADGRCPGCRKPYDPSTGNKGMNVDVLPIRLARSCSMGTRLY